MPLAGSAGRNRSVAVADGTGVFLLRDCAPAGVWEGKAGSKTAVNEELMNATQYDGTDDRLVGMLREARIQAGLLPRFAEGVWRRIGLAETPVRLAPAWLVRLATVILRPRAALVGVVTLMMLGATLGTLQTRSYAMETAQARYLASVAPAEVRQP